MTTEHRNLLKMEALRHLITLKMSIAELEKHATDGKTCSYLKTELERVDKLSKELSEGTL